MKKYACVSVRIPRGFQKETYEHRKIIDEYARKGYRYVGYIPMRIKLYGRTLMVDLIFEADDGDV